MSTPVVTDQWAGNFDCEGPCRRKRLMAEEFSKKALERHRNQIRQPQNKPIILRCKQCIAEAERLEREASAKKKAQTQANGTGGSSEKEESRKCGSCGKVLPQSAFNRNQWSKGEGKSRCRQCVEESIKQEAQQQSQSKTDQIAAAKLKVEQARKSKSASAILAAESELAALEAEKVTGLKPVRMGTGGGEEEERSSHGDEAVVVEVVEKEDGEASNDSAESVDDCDVMTVLVPTSHLCSSDELWTFRKIHVRQRKNGWKSWAYRSIEPLAHCNPPCASDNGIISILG